MYEKSIGLAMGTVSVRLSEDLEARLEEYVTRENLDRSTAVRRLLASGLSEWRRDRAVNLVREGEATVSRGAELAGMDVWAFTDLLEERDVTWVDDEELADDLDDP